MIEKNSTVQLLCADTYSHLLEHATEFLRSHRNDEVLFLAPRRGAADDLVWRLGDSFGVHRFTLNGLAAVIAAPLLAKQGLKPANQLAVEAVAARVLHELRRDDVLHYFRPVAALPGFPRALARTLSELRLNGVSSEALEHGGEPGRDLARCLEAYGKLLLNHGLADLATIYGLAIESFAAPTNRFRGLPLLLLDVAPAEELRRALFKLWPADSRAVLAGILRADTTAVSHLQSVLGVPCVRVVDDSNSATLHRVHSCLFASGSENSAGLDASVDYFSSPGEALECVEIARRILRAASDDGLPFDSFAVALRSPDRYGPQLEEAFRRAKIPAYFTGGVIRPDPAGRAFLSLLSCGLENCSATRFAEYLSLGEVPAGPSSQEDHAPAGELHSALQGDGQGTAASLETATDSQRAAELEGSPLQAGTLQAPQHWEKLLIDAAVVGGAERWHRRLDGLENELRLQLERCEPGDPDRAFRESELVRLRSLRDFALPLISALTRLPDRAPWGEWLRALDALARQSLRQPDSVCSLLAELHPMGDVGPVALAEVYTVLSDRLRFLRRDPPRRPYGYVFVCSIEELRGRSFPVVFLPGLSEGQFPRRVQEDSLLLDAHRDKVHPSLETNRERREGERLLLHIAAAAAASRLVFSYPRIDVVEGRARVPSFYALELISAALGYLPELREFQASAAKRSPARLDKPAPEEFESAIDDAEYDLVALQRAIHAPPAEAKGAMSFLLSVNAPLCRSLQMRYARWEKSKWNSADGLIATSATEAALFENSSLRQRTYSPTALQLFASCPYRFALSAIIGLRRRSSPAPVYQIDALTRGAIFHEIQRDVLRQLMADDLLPPDAERTPLIRQLADVIFRRIVDHYHDLLAPAIDRVWRSEMEEIRADIHGWLRMLPSDSEWLPYATELSFGSAPRHGDDSDPLSRTDPALLFDAFPLRGRIDLIEKHVTSGAFRVVDHKTGKALDRWQVFVGGGDVLQPTLYSLAVEHLFQATVDQGKLFYCTQRGEYRSCTVPLSASARGFAERALGIIDGAVRAGVLAAVPREGTCEICDYRSACGPYEHIRILRKESTPEELDELRRMP